MLMLNAVENILNTFPISLDIQNKILLLFISLGTPSANIIKTESLKLDNINHYNDNSKTLWRLKIHNNNYKILSYSFILNIARYELCIAANNSFEPLNNETYNCVYKTTFKILTKNHLYSMFYNLDKFKYGEYGTPTANIIRIHFYNI